MERLLGTEIYDLIPQRPPFVQIDAFYEANNTDAHTGLTVTEGNYFILENKLQESGIIEHIAQSAAAFAGYPYYVNGESPKLGYIGEVKKCKIHNLPTVGTDLHTHLSVVSELGGITLIKAMTKTSDDVAVADCQMKIFIQD